MLSFIVPAHNEARLLGATLDALHAAARACGVEYELLVVDDASTDGTAAVAIESGARVLRVEHRHIAATRNAGACIAAGDVFVFVDADTLVGADVLRAAWVALADGAVGGGAAVRLAGPVRVHERAMIETAIVAFRLARIAPGCFVFCTRAAFEAAGGFDERYFAGEDVALSRALARQGRFAILRGAVFTSARKLRTHSALDHLRLIARFAWRPRGLLRSRHGLDLWYGERRDETDRP